MLLWGGLGAVLSLTYAQFRTEPSARVGGQSRGDRTKENRFYARQTEESEAGARDERKGECIMWSKAQRQHTGGGGQ